MIEANRASAGASPKALLNKTGFCPALGSMAVSVRIARAPKMEFVQHRELAKTRRTTGLLCRRRMTIGSHGSVAVSGVMHKRSVSCPEQRTPVARLFSVPCN
jgi:hypothetical protein